MTRPRLLDLFSGAGGAAWGYHLAGFDVVGVDHQPQPRYPFEHHVADALTFPLDGFDAIHASPPCQAFTTMSNRYRGGGGRVDRHVDLIAPVRARLAAAGVPYVIENVPGARRALLSPVLLHGGMFGLGVHRPRYFESSVVLMVPKTPPALNPVGVYGAHPDGRRLWTRADGTSQRAAVSLEEGGEAMGIGWMTWAELTESIPPAYTEHIGGQLLAALTT